MSGLANYLINTISSAIFGVKGEEESMATSFYDSDRYSPSTTEVLAVKDALFQRFKLPLELIDRIIDFAEYWPRTTTCRTGGQLHVRSGRPDFEDQFLLRSYPLGYIPKKTATTVQEANLGAQPYLSRPATPYNPKADPIKEDSEEDIISHWTEANRIRGEHACRKIVFTLVSHDQGWGGPGPDRGTYRSSFTWFDVGKEKIHVSKDTSIVNPSSHNAFPMILPEQESPDLVEGDAPLACTIETISPTVHASAPNRFEHPLMPTMKCLQKNLTATREPQEHKIVWSCNDDIADPDSMEAQALEERGRGRDTGNGDYVRDMKVGDVVTVWAKARFPGWVNVVESVRIDVYYAV